MAERLVAVASAEGLHARPAALFVKAATAAGIPITIAKATQPSTADAPAADARSILAVLALDVRHGDEVVLRADGDGAEAALDQLVSLLRNADA